MSQRINLPMAPYVRNMYTQNYDKSLNNFEPESINLSRNVRKNMLGGEMHKLFNKCQNCITPCSYYGSYLPECRDCLLRCQLSSYYNYQYGRPYSYYTLPENYYYPYY